MAGYRLKRLAAMARINLRVDDNEARFLEDDESAVPVAGIGKHLFARATVIEEQRGELRFVGEIPIKVYPGQEKQLRLLDHPPNLQSPSWRSLDVLTRERAAARKYAVVATYPYTLDWVDAARFKPPGTHHHNKIELDIQRRNAIEYSRGPLVYLRDVLSYDLFETRNAYLTASLANPERSDQGVATGHRYDNWSGARGNKRRGGMTPQPSANENLEESWVFGVCPNAEACLRRLLQDERAAELLASTDDGTLFERRNLGDSVLRMHEVTTETSRLAHSVLESSAKKALAGPIYNVADWIDGRRPVFDLVEEIYCLILYELNRRNRYNEKGRRLLPNKIPKQKQITSHYPYWLGRQENELALLPEEADEALLLAALARNLDADEVEVRFRACVYAAALRRMVDKALLPVARLTEIARCDDQKSVRIAARMSLKEIEAW